LSAEIIGWIGSVMLLTGYFTVRRYKLLSDFLNIFGSQIMAIYGWLMQAYAVVVLNIAWLTVGLWHLFKEAANHFGNSRKSKVRLRPSSHSTDYTVVATLSSTSAAERIKKKLRRLLAKKSFDLDWSYIFFEQKENKVLLNVYTNHRAPKEFINLLLKEKSVEEAIMYLDKYYVTVTVDVPEGVSLETAVLLFPKEQAEALRQLAKVCQVQVQDTPPQLVFTYVGEDVFRSFDGSSIEIGDAKILRKWKHWHISMIPKGDLRKIKAKAIIKDSKYVWPLCI